MDPIAPSIYMPAGDRFSYRPTIKRPVMELPNGARVAFWVGLNIECYDPLKPGIAIHVHGPGVNPDPLNQGWVDYGPRVGVWRVMDGLDSAGLRASVLLNADVCTVYPEIIDAGNARNWVWLAHGRNNSTPQQEVAGDREYEYLRDVVAIITSGTGRPPRGWLGPGLSETFQTPDHLAKLGIEYICDWCNDDLPYEMKVIEGRMISVPYSIELNDIPMCVGKGMTGPQVYEAITDQFDVLYQEATRTGPRVMCLALHPFVIGTPFRYKHLMRALSYITRHSGVWLTTSDDIANWYYSNYYDSGQS